MGSDESATMFARRRPEANAERVHYVDDALLLIDDLSAESRDPKENRIPVPLPQTWSDNADLLVDNSITSRQTNAVATGRQTLSHRKHP